MEEREREYTFMDGKFICEANGRVVAELSDAKEVVFLPGCKGPHKATLNEWLERNGMYFGERQPEAAASELPEEPNMPEKQAPPIQACDIPEGALPPFTKALGVDTPGFMEFVRQYNLTEQEIAGLIRRMEKR